MSPSQSLLGETEENRSTWQGFSKKVRVLLPYMWPRGNIFLQLLVLFCLTLLAVERVINVFVPIYYKNIGEAPFFGYVRAFYQSRMKTIIINVHPTALQCDGMQLRHPSDG